MSIRLLFFFFLTTLTVISAITTNQGIESQTIIIEEYIENGQKIEILGPPSLPKRFRAKAVLISHQANKTREYPPWRTVYRVSMDYIDLKARVDVLEGFDKGRTFYRRYDRKREYLVESIEEEAKTTTLECRRSYLSESMPKPDFPTDPTYVGLVSFGSEGSRLAHWTIETEGVSRVHIFSDPATGIPLRLTEEWIEDDGVSVVPLMTYEWTDFVVVDEVTKDDEEIYDLPSPFASDPQHRCERQIGGFPYLHIFHTYVRV